MQPAKFSSLIAKRYRPTDVTKLKQSDARRKRKDKGSFQRVVKLALPAEIEGEEFIVAFLYIKTVLTDMYIVQATTTLEVKHRSRVEA